MCYWKIINKVMRKSKAPKIPPVFVNKLFVLNCKEKVNIFTEFFSKQCTPVITDIVLHNLSYLTNEEVEQIL